LRERHLTITLFFFSKPRPNKVAMFLVAFSVISFALANISDQATVKELCHVDFPGEVIEQIFPVNPIFPESPCRICNCATCRPYRDERLSVVVRTDKALYWYFANRTALVTGDKLSCLSLVSKYPLNVIFPPGLDLNQFIQWVKESRSMPPNCQQPPSGCARLS
jgi:hypothetical protein